MTEDDFKANANAAILLHSKAQTPAEDAFWAGYIRGLRQNYRGIKYGAQAKGDDQERQAGERGYRLGIDGENVDKAKQIMQELLTIGKDD